MRLALVASLAFAVPAMMHGATTIQITVPGTGTSWTADAIDGAELTLAVTDPMPDGSWQWYFNDAPISGATGPRWVLHSATTEWTGNYQVRHVDERGAVASSDFYTVNVRPALALPSAVDTSYSAEIDPRASSASPVAIGSDGSVIARVATPDIADTYVRLLPDGARDRTFTLSPVDGDVLVMLADGGLIMSKAPFRRDVHGGPLPFELPAGFDSTQPLAAAAALSDGRIVLAQGPHLGCIDPHGTPDPTYGATFSEPGDIVLLVGDFSNRVLVYRNAPDPLTPDSAIPIRRLTATGSLDPSFQPAPQLRSVYSNIAGRALVPLRAGGYMARLEGQTVITRLNDDGAIDPSWGTLVLIAFQPRAYIITDTGFDSAGRTFVISYRSALQRYQSEQGNVSSDATFNPGQPGGVSDWPWISSVDAVGEDHVLVSGHFTNWDGHPTVGLARLRSGDRVAVPPQVFVTTGLPPRRGATARIDASVSGAGPFTYQWTALDGQPLPADIASPQLVLSSFSSAQLGRYQVRVTGEGGTTLGRVVTLTIDDRPPRLMNLSGRAMTGEGDETLVAGLVNRAPTSSLVRAVGPSLATQGIVDPIPQPELRAYDRTGQPVQLRDDPQNRWAELGARLGAFPLVAGSADDVAVADGPAGPTTFHVVSKAPVEHGVALLEIYATESDQLANLSLRARTGTGDATAVAGFVIADPTGFGRTARLLLRAIGPTLSAQGITHPLANPILTLFDRAGTVIATNDDWAVNNTSADAPALATTMKQVGAFDLPTDSKDAALLMDLAPGVYTMHATGGEGVVLLEIYLVP